MIVAGGSGLRCGGDRPKQFQLLNGIPILVRTADKFAAHADSVVIVVHKDWIGHTQALFNGHKLKNKIHIVTGGSDRMSSVVLGIEYIVHTLGGNVDDVMLTHDAVRPFVTDEVIAQNIDKARQYGACGTFIPAIDTIAVSQDGQFVSNVPDRTQYYQVQTPQTFCLGILQKLLESYQQCQISFTDLCGLAAHYGQQTAMVMGHSHNLKITTPADFHVARAILSKEENPCE